MPFLTVMIDRDYNFNLQHPLVMFKMFTFLKQLFGNNRASIFSLQQAKGFF